MNKPMVTASKMTPVRIIAAQISLNEFKQELSSLPAYSAMPTLRLANAQRARLDLRVVPPKRAGVERNRSFEVIRHNRCAVEFNVQRRRRRIRRARTVTLVAGAGTGRRGIPRRVKQFEHSRPGRRIDERIADARILALKVDGGADPFERFKRPIPIPTADAKVLKTSAIAGLIGLNRVVPYMDMDQFDLYPTRHSQRDIRFLRAGPVAVGRLRNVRCEFVKGSPPKRRNALVDRSLDVFNDETDLGRMKSGEACFGHC
jgi:hypothetical protein